MSTLLFGGMMAFAAVRYLTQPASAVAFAHLGFPAYFRIELAVAKLLGTVALVAPVPARFSEWAYAGFGITLISAVVAHSVVDGPARAVSPVVAFAVLSVSYLARDHRARGSL